MGFRIFMFSRKQWLVAGLMGFITKSVVCFILSWACAKLNVTGLLDGRYDYGKIHSLFHHELPEDLDKALFYPPYNIDFGNYRKSSTEQLDHYDVPSDDYFSDTEADIEFERVVQPVRGLGMLPFPEQKDPPELLTVLCSEKQMKVTLPAGPIEKIGILGSKGFIPVLKAPESCGYIIRKGVAHNMLTIPSQGCHVTVKDGTYTVSVTYQIDEEKGAVTLSCPKSSSPRSSDRLIHGNTQRDEAASGGTRRIFPLASKDGAAQAHNKSVYQSSGTSQHSRSFIGRNPCSSFQPSSSSNVKKGNLCTSTHSSPVKGGPPGSNRRSSFGSGTRGSRVKGGPPVSGTRSPPRATVKSAKPRSRSRGERTYSSMQLTTSNPNFMREGCNILQSQQVQCGPPKISASLCLARGCCVEPQTSACFYPMDECTADKKFVFAVYYNDSSFPVDPTSLIVAGKGSCTPVIKSNDFAIFMFSVTDCGTHTFEVGQTVVYLAEVQTSVRVYNLKYGVISRDSPLRLLVECRYPKSSLGEATLVSVGYMVMSPSLPPSVVSGGLFGVQLRIATDRTYTKFYPHYHRPLKLLLGKSVFLELRLMAQNRSAVLLVNYCLAYPRSAKNALVLLYEGCPNPLDGVPTSILHVKGLPQTKHKRRFEIKAFQFMELKSKKYLDEEIYFMCSTEVCLPSEKQCIEGCFG